MGLSDEERIKGIYNCINTLYTAPNNKSYDLKQINKLISKLWYNFIGKSGNSAHWFLGGDFDLYEWN